MAWTLTLDCEACSETFWGDSETERICPICGGVLTIRVSEMHQKGGKQINDRKGVVKHQPAQSMGFFTRRGVVRLSDELRLAVLARWRDKTGNCQIRVRTIPTFGVQ